MTQTGLAGWFLDRHAALRGACICALGAGAALGHAPVHAFPVTLLALAVFLILLKHLTTVRSGAFYTWLFATAYFAVSLRWLVEPFQVEADIFAWMAPFALTLMAAGLALFWGAAGALAAKLTSPGAPRVLVAIAAISMAELARAYVLTGFPWAGLAQIWINTPLAQMLAWIGPQGLGFVSLLLAAIPALFSGYGFAALVATPMILMFPVLKPETLASTAPIIRIVQPNAPQVDKWNPDKAHIFFERQIEATRAPAPQRPDLIVWPETAIAQLYNHADETLAVVAQAAAGVPLVLGMQRAQGYAYFNSLLVMNGQGRVDQFYDKHHLVPFGEYMPLPQLFQSLGISALAQRAQSGYSAGQGPEILDLGRAGTALPLICYEAVFPQHAKAPDGRPDMLLQITNDAWFGTYAGPQQHLAQARMRAIEQGLPLIRSANTGISALIGPRGAILAQLPLGEHGFLDHAVPPALPPTLYSKIGDAPVLALVVLLIGAVFARSRRNTARQVVND